jgi:hypothetical protein
MIRFGSREESWDFRGCGQPVHPQLCTGHLDEGRPLMGREA